MFSWKLTSDRASRARIQVRHPFTIPLGRPLTLLHPVPPSVGWMGSWATAVCVCVCRSERKRERERECTRVHSIPYIFISILLSKKPELKRTFRVASMPTPSPYLSVSLFYPFSDPFGPVPFCFRRLLDSHTASPLLVYVSARSATLAGERLLRVEDLKNPRAAIAQRTISRTTLQPFLEPTHTHTRSSTC